MTSKPSNRVDSRFERTRTSISEACTSREHRIEFHHRHSPDYITPEPSSVATMIVGQPPSRRIRTTRTSSSSLEPVRRRCRAAKSVRRLDCLALASSPCWWELWRQDYCLLECSEEAIQTLNLGHLDAYHGRSVQMLKTVLESSCIQCRFHGMITWIRTLCAEWETSRGGF
jgi:hypothetical protein